MDTCAAGDCCRRRIALAVDHKRSLLHGRERTENDGALQSGNLFCLHFVNGCFGIRRDSGDCDLSQGAAGNHACTSVAYHSMGGRQNKRMPETFNFEHFCARKHLRSSEFGMGIRPVKLIYNFELDKDVKFESLRCLPTSSRQSFLGNAAVTAFATMSPSAFTFAMTAAPAEAAAPVGSPWTAITSAFPDTYGRRPLAQG